MLRTLGGLALEGSDFHWQKPLLLLTYVALEGRRTRREVAELFWPSAADRMKSLSVALTQLRHGVPGVVHADRRDLEVDVELDVARFRRALDERDLELALHLYRGRFLDGFDERHVGTDLEAWIYETREREADRLRSALLSAARRSAAAADGSAAAKLAAQAFELPGATPPDPPALAELHALLVAGGHPLARQVASDAAELGLDLGGAPTGEASPGSPHGPAADRPLLSPRTPLVGREAELEQALALLSDPAARIVTLVGPGGIGKTRLALELAGRLNEAWALGTGLPVAGPVTLESVRTGGQFVREMASALGMRLAGGQSTDLLERQLAERFRASPAVIVLDGCEHLADGECLSALSRVLAAAPGARALVTSRAPLQIAGEHVFRLHGLPLDQDEAPEGGPGPAERLFELCARRTAPGFDAARQRDAVRRCCSLLDGLPLGIELAAAWAGTLPVDAIVDEIRSDPGFLAGPGPHAPGEHVGLRGVFERSWALLTEDEQRAFAALAVFEGGFTRAAASFVADVDAAMLRRLVRGSLVAFDAGAGRYRVHELIRAFAAERLEALDATVAVLARHGAYFCSWMRARERDLEGDGQAAATDAIARELPNVRAAFLHAAASGARPLLEQAATALGRYYERRGPFSEGVEVFARAVDLLEGARTHDPLAASLHARLASLWRLQGAAPASRAAIAAGLERLPAPGRASDVASARARARLEHQAGMLALGSDNVAAARALERAADGYRAAGLVWEATRAQGKRGLALLGQGRDVEASGALEEALDAATDLGDAAGTADLLATAAWAAALHARFDDAEGLIRASEGAYDAAGDLAGAAAGYGRLGMTAVWLGAFDPAKALFEKSLAAHRAIGEWWSLPAAHAAVGLGHLHIGAYLETDREARTGLGMARRLANPVAEAHSLWLLGATALTRDDFTTAVQRFRNSVALCRLGSEAHEAIPSVALLAMAYRGLGRQERAWSVVRIALRRSVEAMDFRSLMLALAAFALLLAEAGEVNAAASVSALIARYKIVRNCRFFQQMSARNLTPLLATLEPRAVQGASALVDDLDPWRAAATLAECRGADKAAPRLAANATAPT
jgi:predicted ATPase